AHRLLPDWGSWIELASPTTRLVWTKLVLLGLTIGLAVHARLRVLPGLTADRLPVMAAHIVAVTVLAVLFVVVGVAFRTDPLG
ncbi:MAG: copper resistance protein CopD, partial [Candidatus Methylacidiphilaceae bacterium]